jgi:hypothetical protein
MLLVVTTTDVVTKAKRKDVTNETKLVTNETKFVTTRPLCQREKPQFHGNQGKLGAL